MAIKERIKLIKYLLGPKLFYAVLVADSALIILIIYYFSQ